MKKDYFTFHDTTIVTKIANNYQYTRLGLWNTPTAFLQRGKTPPKCPEYEIKQSDGEAPVMELCEMWSIPSLSLVSGLLRLGVVEPGRVLSIGSNRTI